MVTRETPRVNCKAKAQREQRKRNHPASRREKQLSNDNVSFKSREDESNNRIGKTKRTVSMT